MAPEFGVLSNLQTNSGSEKYVILHDIVMPLKNDYINDFLKLQGNCIDVSLE